MKKILTLIVFLTAIGTVQAQVNFGIKGGLNVTKLSLDTKIVDSSNQTGFFVGPTLKFTLPIIGLGIDASALYDQRSNELEDSSTGQTVTVTAKQKSIQVPVNVRYGFGLGDAASIYIFVGPQFGFHLGDRSVETEVGEWTFRSSNLSGNAGVGAMLFKHLQLSVNYNFALGKTGEFEVKNMKDFDGKMNSWQLALALYF